MMSRRVVMRKSDDRRHVLSLSGGKDSAALAVYLKDKIPDLEYVFMDTGYELPETYEFLDRMRAMLGIHITKLKPERGFDYWYRIFKGCLPAPNNRWCTRELKIKPYEAYIGSDRIVSYVGLRADEDRMGYFSTKDNILPMYPFIEDQLCRDDIINILEESGLGLPKYYEWRSRSGCFFCFYQQRNEWIGLYDNHPDLFEQACEYERNHLDGRTYTWVEGVSLKELLDKRDEIPERPDKKDIFNESKLSNIFKEQKFTIGEKSILKNSLNKPNKNEDEECLFCIL